MPDFQPEEQHLQEHLHWGAEALWQQLEPLLPGLSVEVVARTESTNTRLLERARESSGQPDARVSRPGELDALHDDEGTPHGRRQGDIQPCLLVAEHQTRGRGRMGRGWEASVGASLTFSLSLALAPADWSGLSLAVGLALAQALGDVTGDKLGGKTGDVPDVVAADMTTNVMGAGRVPRIRLKWPNDLWLCLPDQPGRKLGGILIETISVGHRRMCVVGVGLNVAPQTFDGLSQGYACLQEIHHAATAPTALAQVAAPLVRALLRFETQGFAPLVADYARHDLLRGQQVITTLPDAQGGMVEGVAEGVDERGALRVRSGTLHHVVSGEVSVRLQSSPAA